MVMYVVVRIFDRDLDVLGYHIPSGVNIIMHEHMMSLDMRYYGEDAKEFVPERWLRDETWHGKCNRMNDMPIKEAPYSFQYMSVF